MAFMEILFSLILFLSCAWLVHSIDVHEAPKSITLNLIHPFSVHSPFYPGKNRTDVEKSNLLIQATEARMQHLFPTTTIRRHRSQNGSSEVDGIATPLTFSDVYYLAVVGIGSFPPAHGRKWKNYLLIMDTGSDITWVQCEGCDPCVPLSQPNYPYRRSQSYGSIPCGHHDCPTPREDCFGSFCGFDAEYGVGSGGASTKGTIIRETLTFLSDSRLVESYPNFLLGCGLQNHDHLPADNKAAGILGLGREGDGTSPLWKQVNKKRFSYCLFSSEHGSSKLYIGEGARLVGPHVLSTRLLRGSNPWLYYVDLQDISIAGEPLGLQGSFSGGCTLDTGAPVTMFASNVYPRVKAGFIRYFARFDIHPYGGNRPGDVPHFDLCFPRRPDFNSFPTMTFHFRRTALVVQPIGVVAKGQNYICVALASGADSTIIGAYQQAQYRFSYDLELGNAGTLFFAPEDCGARA